MDGRNTFHPDPSMGQSESWQYFSNLSASDQATFLEGEHDLPPQSDFNSSSDFTPPVTASQYQYANAGLEQQHRSGSTDPALDKLESINSYRDHLGFGSTTDNSNFINQQHSDAATEGNDMTFAAGASGVATLGPFWTPVMQSQTPLPALSSQQRPPSCSRQSPPTFFGIPQPQQSRQHYHTEARAGGHHANRFTSMNPLPQSGAGLSNPPMQQQHISPFQHSIPDDTAFNTTAAAIETGSHSLPPPNAGVPTGKKRRAPANQTMKRSQRKANVDHSFGEDEWFSNRNSAHPVSPNQPGNQWTSSAPAPLSRAVTVPGAYPPIGFQGSITTAMASTMMNIPAMAAPTGSTFEVFTLPAGRNFQLSYGNPRRCSSSRSPSCTAQN